MADTKISALTAISAALGAQEFPVNDAGTTKKITLAQINAYCEPLYNASVANQGAGFASDTYLTGSSIAIPSGRLQAKTMYECVFNVTKTAAGTAAPAINIRFGTAGTTADASVCAMTHSAQSAVTDEGLFVVRAIFRTVGSGTSAVIQGVSMLEHEKGYGNTASTGLSVVSADHVATTGGGFNSTVASSIIGLSVNGGASASWTVNLVQAKLMNLL